MPDWIAHIAVAWTLCTVLGFKYKQFNQGNAAIAMLGSVVPDFIKISIITEYLGVATWDFITPIHLPLGSVIIAAMMSLFFKERKVVFLFLTLGIITHYALDLLETDLSGGMYLLYPLTWNQWQLGLISTDNYQVTIISVIVALVVYIIYRIHEKKI